MSPELQFLLTTMHGDIRAIAERVGGIEEKLSEGRGARNLWVGLHRMLGPIVAALAGAAAGHYWPQH